MDAVANQKWKPDGEVETRYRKARQEWDRRIGSAVVQARNWRLATLFSLGLVLVSLIGTIYLGAQPKAAPHIVQVDRIGAPTYFGPVGQSRTPAVIKVPTPLPLPGQLQRVPGPTQGRAGEAQLVAELRLRHERIRALEADLASARRTPATVPICSPEPKSPLTRSWPTSGRPSKATFLRYVGPAVALPRGPGLPAGREHQPARVGDLGDGPPRQSQTGERPKRDSKIKMTLLRLTWKVPSRQEHLAPISRLHVTKGETVTARRRAWLKSRRTRS